AEPGAELESGEAALGESRHVRQRGCTPRTGHGERLHLAAGDVPGRGAGEVEEHRHPARDEVGIDRAAALVRNMRELDGRRDAEELAGEVAARAGTGRPVGELPRLLLAARDDVLQALR